MREARVITEHKTNYVIVDGGTEYIATVRGAFFDNGVFPKVGDFVHYSEVAEGKAAIEDILPRRSTIVRAAVGTPGEQVIVANVDLLFIVMGLDGDFNLSRLERYLLLATQSQVAPVVVLNKADSVPDPDVYERQVVDVVASVPVHVVSAITGAGLASLRALITPGTTVVLLGSSGAGKSTITNWLLHADTQTIQAVRADDSHGRHTTTARQLFALPNGGYLIDTPGMRELGVYSTAADEDEVFATLDAIAAECRFSNCDHDKSQGCAIIAAIEAGDITERQRANYLKLQRERLFASSKHDAEAAREYRQTQKHLHQGYREIKKRNRSGKRS